MIWLPIRECAPLRRGNFPGISSKLNRDCKPGSLLPPLRVGAPPRAARTSLRQGKPVFAAAQGEFGAGPRHRSFAAASGILAARADKKFSSMSSSPRILHPAWRIMSLLLFAALISGCGQKGDLYRAGKQKSSFAGTEYSVQG
jgi:hypothetical protein